MSTRVAPLVVLMALACGSSPAESPKTAESSDSPKDEPDASEAAAAKAEWDRLVAAELVWLRPDLDASCDGARAGHHMASSAEPFEQRVLMASKLGCKPVTFVLPGGQGGGSPGGFPGGNYCCPRDLPPAPPPHAGGGKTCEQAQEEYVAATETSKSSEQPSAGAYGAVLNRGTYFKNCSV